MNTGFFCVYKVFLWVPRALLCVFTAFVDGYCSTVQGLLDWSEVDLGFPELVLLRFISNIDTSRM